jgi:hypothetical protein
VEVRRKRRSDREGGESSRAGRGGWSSSLLKEFVIRSLSFSLNSLQKRRRSEVTE